MNSYEIVPLRAFSDTATGKVETAKADWCVCTIPLSILGQIESEISDELAAAIDNLNADHEVQGVVVMYPLRARRPDMAFVTVPGVGHVPTLSEPEARDALTGGSWFQGEGWAREGAQRPGLSRG